MKEKYFFGEGLRNWVFGTKVKDEHGEKRLMKLVLASDTPFRRHVKIKSLANPYDPTWEQYFEDRHGRTYQDRS